MLEDGDASADTWFSDGLAKLSKLEPDDEVLRLRRVMDAIDERQTAEARVEASKAMLTPAAIAQLGRRVAARVAFDLAALSRRTGDGQAFEKYLLFALELDPFFPEATETAAGYFRMNAPTVVDEVCQTIITLFTLIITLLSNNNNHRSHRTKTGPVPLVLDLRIIIVIIVTSVIIIV